MSEIWLEDYYMEPGEGSDPKYWCPILTHAFHFDPYSFRVERDRSHPGWTITGFKFPNNYSQNAIKQHSVEKASDIAPSIESEYEVKLTSEIVQKLRSLGL